MAVKRVLVYIQVASLRSAIDKHTPELKRRRKLGWHAGFLPTPIFLSAVVFHLLSLPFGFGFRIVFTAVKGDVSLFP